MRRIGRGALLFVASAVVSHLLILNLCHAMFRCGCESWWNRAAELCNVNRIGVKHCPWCSYGDAGFWLAMGLILAPQFVLSFWPGAMPWRRRVPAVLAMFPAAGALVALGYGWYAGYWQ